MNAKAVLQRGRCDLRKHLRSEAQCTQTGGRCKSASEQAKIAAVLARSRSHANPVSFNERAAAMPRTDAAARTAVATGATRRSYLSVRADRRNCPLVAREL